MKNLLTSKQKVILLPILLIIFVVLLIAIVLVSYGKNPIIQEFQISNNTDSGVTVIWTTEEESSTKLFFRKKGDTNWSKKIYFDDRDTERNENGNLVLSDKNTKRQTHHVSVGGLDPETEYEFSVGGIIKKVTKLSDGKKFPTAVTKAINDNISTPDPAYGQIDGINEDVDHIAMLTLVSETSDSEDLMKVSETISTPVSNSKSYSLDLNSFRFSLVDYAEYADELSLYLEILSPDGTRSTTVLAYEDYKPLDTIIVSDTEAKVTLDNTLITPVSAQTIYDSYDSCMELVPNKKYTGCSCGEVNWCDLYHNHNQSCPSICGTDSGSTDGSSDSGTTGDAGTSGSTVTTSDNGDINFTESTCIGVSPVQTSVGAITVERCTTGGLSNSYCGSHAGTVHEIGGECHCVCTNSGINVDGFDPETVPTNSVTPAQEGTYAPDFSTPPTPADIEFCPESQGGGVYIPNVTNAEPICDKKYAASTSGGAPSGICCTAPTVPLATNDGTVPILSAWEIVNCPGINQEAIEKEKGCDEAFPEVHSAIISTVGSGSLSTGEEVLCCELLGTVDTGDDTTGDNLILSQEQALHQWHDIFCDRYGEGASSKLESVGCSDSESEAYRGKLAEYEFVCCVPKPDEADTQNILGAVSAQSDTNTEGLEVDSSGYYVFYVDGEKIGEKTLVLSGDGTVTLKLYVDTNGNGLKDDDEEFIQDYTSISIAKEAEAINYNLNSGWNLINLPLIDTSTQNNVSTAKALIERWNSQGADLKHIAKFENGQFIMYTLRENDTEYTNNFELIPGEAYFVFNLGNYTQVSFRGNRIESSVPFPLDNGWNLVGVISPDKGYTAESLVKEINNQDIVADTVSKYEAGRYDSVVYEDSILYGNDYNIIDTQGYFIRVQSGGGQSFEP